MSAIPSPLLLLAAGALTALAAALIFGGLHIIGEQESGLVIRRFGPPLAPGRIIALDGEAGYQADLLAPASLSTSVSGIESIVHCAAFFRGATPEQAHAVNDQGTQRLALAAREAGVKRFLFTSTGLVYGPTGGRPARETDDCAPIAAYPVSKLSAERFLLSLDGLDVRVLRLPFVYGDGDAHIAEALMVHGLASRSEARARAIELLRAVKIVDPDKRVDDYPHQLSGGMRQRVMMAIALACRPPLLIADEPTTALDVTVQAQILELLRDMKREFDLSLLLITHDFGVIAEMADRVAVMYAGKIVEEGPVRNILRHAQHPYTKGLLAAIPGGPFDSFHSAARSESRSGQGL